MKACTLLVLYIYNQILYIFTINWLPQYEVFTRDVSVSTWSKKGLYVLQL